MTLEALDLAINQTERFANEKQEISWYNNQLSLVLCHFLGIYWRGSCREFGLENICIFAWLTGNFSSIFAWLTGNFFSILACLTSSFSSIFAWLTGNFSSIFAWLTGNVASILQIKLKITQNRPQNVKRWQMFPKFFTIHDQTQKKNKNLFIQVLFTIR